MGIVHLLSIIMTNAYDTILNTYDLATCKEIVEHGCQSGVCSEHIYYGDTIKFFDTYEDEIIEYIADHLGGEVNEELWTNNTCNYRGYMNDTVWCFIELVAMARVDYAELEEREEDKTLAEYVMFGWLSNHALSRVWLGTHIPYVHLLFYYDNYT